VMLLKHSGVAAGEPVRNGTVEVRHLGYTAGMSERNGDRARFHKNRTRKLHHRQRIAAFVAKLRARTDEQAPSVAAADSGGRSSAAREPANAASQG
jgi:hypothetical protein